MDRKSLIIFSVLGTIVFLGAMIFAFQKQSPDVGVNNATMASAANNGVWQKRCLDKSNEQCEVFQTIHVGTENQIIRLVEIALSTKDDGATLGVTLPIGITLLNGLGLRVDEGEMMQMPFNTCNANGCIAVSVINQEILNSLRNGEVLNVFFFDGANKKVNVQLTLSGFTQSLSALQLTDL